VVFSRFFGDGVGDVGMMLGWFFAAVFIAFEVHHRFGSKLSSD
jgi:hypothetical protein